jgi:hypothetical protein
LSMVLAALVISETRCKLDMATRGTSAAMSAHGWLDFTHQSLSASLCHDKLLVTLLLCQPPAVLSQHAGSTRS